MKKWTVLVTREVTSTQTCQLSVEAETEDEAKDKASDLATAEHQGAVAWEDDEESFHYGEEGVYVTNIDQAT